LTDHVANKNQFFSAFKFLNELAIFCFTLSLHLTSPQANRFQKSSKKEFANTMAKSAKARLPFRLKIISPTIFTVIHLLLLQLDVVSCLSSPSTTSRRHHQYNHNHHSSSNSLYSHRSHSKCA